MSSTYFDPDELFNRENSSPLNLREFFRKKRDNIAALIGQPLSTAFLKFERENPLFPLTLQLILSEAVEQIAGISISTSIWRHRGFLVCLDRAMVLYSVFEPLFTNLDQPEAAAVAAKGITSLRELMDVLWSGGWWELVRPGTIREPFDSQRMARAQRILFLQYRLVKKLTEIVEFNPAIHSILKSIPSLHQNEIIRIGMSGPIKRASGLVPQRPRVDPLYPRKSTELFYQYAYSNHSHPSIWHAYRVGYCELYLAVNRLFFLLKDYIPPPTSVDRKIDSVTGDATVSLPTPLGSSYLTLSMNDGQVVYFNYVPAEMKNWRGFTQIFSRSDETNYPLILPLFDPKIQIGEI